MAEDDRRYFIIKHGLDAFQVLPNFIWRTGLSAKHVPWLFSRVRVGDRWVAFAFTNNDYREQRLSLITGFYECTHEYRYGSIPAKALPVCDDGETEAWMIEGKPFGKQYRNPVGVPPINEILGRRVFGRAAVIPIKQPDFEKFQDCASSRRFDTDAIPLLGREPRNEQEVLALVIACHKRIGIERIFRVQTAFPDMLVKINGHPEEVYLELELYSRSFRLHGHHGNVQKRKFKDGKAVAILCWIDDATDVKQDVHRVFELQSLIREKKKIQWKPQG